MSNLPVFLALALGACADFDARRTVSEIHGVVLADAWIQANKTDIMAILERCQPGPPTPEEWHFRWPKRSPAQLRSLGPTIDGHPPGSASAVEVDRCIDEGIKAIPPFPEAGKSPNDKIWIARRQNTPVGIPGPGDRREIPHEPGYP